MLKQNKKFTIFGHKGFLGSNFVNALKKKKYEIYLPPKNKIKFKKNLNNVIYCIGSDNVIKEPINGINSNLYILSQIIEKNKFESFTYMSSTRLYLNNNNTNESTKLKIDVTSENYFFNILKIAAENFCLSRKNKKIKVVRLSNLYGVNFTKQVYLLPTLIRNSIKKKEIKISISKKSKKNYLNVEDAINMIIKIINTGKYRIYNIASNKRITIEKIALNIKKVTNCKIKFTNQRQLINEPVISINRIKKEFGFKPNNNFESLISTIIKKY